MKREWLKAVQFYGGPLDGRTDDLSHWITRNGWTWMFNLESSERKAVYQLVEWTHCYALCFRGYADTIPRSG